MIKGLPDRLKELRLKNGLSQKQVAQRIGMSTSIISSYETGERTPSAEIILSISYLYSCSTDYLLGKKTDDSQFLLNTANLNKDQIIAMQALINTING